MNANRREVVVTHFSPKRGSRGHFLKITITIPPKMLSELKLLGLRRRANGQKNTDVSSLIREAVSELLQNEG